MASKHTTSIVDISEIEDDECAPLADESSIHHHQHQSNQHQQQHQQQQQQQSGAFQAHLYLYHEDLHPHQRIPNLLSMMSSQPSDLGSQKSSTSPSQTLLRQQQQQQQQQLNTNIPHNFQLAAIDYQPANNNEQFAQNNNNNNNNNTFDTTASSQAAPDLRPATPAPSLAAGQTGETGGNKANLGTLSGVYFPCVQNIFGVILFIRMAWIVGTAGVPAAFALVFICCCVTLTTSISLSAIATNGIVPAGGSYFMISRSLGPECGGAVGTMFFLGTTFAGAMYITGAVEIMLNYLAPSWGLFGDFQRDVNILYHNIRIYGTLLLIIVGLMVWIGVKFVSKLAPIALFCVLFSIFSIYLGIFVNYNGRPDLMVCVLGDRLVTLKNIPYEEPTLHHDDQAQLRNLTSRLSASEQESLWQLRRTKALCTYEKLRFIYCPNMDLTQQQQQQQQLLQQQSDQMSMGTSNDFQQPQVQQQQQQPDEKQLMQELFKRPPNMSNCDPYFRANRDRIHLERAVPGIASGVLFQNLKPRFREKRTIVSYDDGTNTNDKSDFNNVFVDITTTFTILISIYFPSCTGILAGSNRSGDLADAQKSIPRGTIAAQLTTSFVYLSCIVLFGATFNNLFIRDKFGECIGGQLAVTQIAWPHPFFILIGGLLSTLGASLQSLVGAPRILQGIAKDEVIPCFKRFAQLSARGEPQNAILFTLGISWLAVLIGNLDFIAPILTLSLVMCYFFINLACTLHSLLGSPNWRPRFKHYHWSISTLGCLLCLFVMIVSSLLYFLLATFLAGCIYKYIEFSGAEKEWGDGKQGLALSAARYNLLRLKTSEPHTKNWRPQVLLFCKLKPKAELEPASARVSSSNMQRKEQQFGQFGQNPRLSHGKQLALMPANTQQQQQPESATVEQLDDSGELNELDELRLAHPKLLTFASQLKAGKGLTLVSSIIEGDFKRAAPMAARARATLQECMHEEKVKGFADVLIAPSIMDGLSYQVQTAGLGGLKHNTVIVGWPEHWRRSSKTTPGFGLSAGSAAAAAAGAERGSFKANARPNHAAAAAAAAAHHHARNSSGGASNCQQQQQQQQRQSGAHLFIELMRNVQVSQNALLVMKGIDSWPESCDKLGGHIDIWWIVNDGGLLMLLPHLLRQHRTWKSCQLRIFTVAQANDNSEQMRADLRKFLYHLRIEAQVDIVEMNNTEVSDYAYERTLMMEQRTEIIKRLSANQRKQSLLLEQEVDGRVIRFRIRKPSTCDFEDTAAMGFISTSSCTSNSSTSNNNNQSATNASAAAAMSPNGVSVTPTLPPLDQNVSALPLVELDSAHAQANQAGAAAAAADQQAALVVNSLRPDEVNVRRMHTALTLNEAILKRSKSAKLVIINLPGAPKASTPEAENNYMEFIEIITDKLERVLLVQNGGREVITIHS